MDSLLDLQQHSNLENLIENIQENQEKCENIDENTEEKPKRRSHVRRRTKASVSKVKCTEKRISCDSIGSSFMPAANDEVVVNTDGDACTLQNAAFEGGLDLENKANDEKRIYNGEKEASDFDYLDCRNNPNESVNIQNLVKEFTTYVDTELDKKTKYQPIIQSPEKEAARYGTELENRDQLEKSAICDLHDSASRNGLNSNVFADTSAIEADKTFGEVGLNEKIIADLMSPEISGEVAKKTFWDSFRPGHDRKSSLNIVQVLEQLTCQMR